MEKKKINPGCSILLLLLCVLIAYIVFRKSLPERMAAHYEKYNVEMQELSEYVKNAIDDSCYVWAVFDKDGIYNYRVQLPNSDNVMNIWDYPNTDSVMNLIGLDKADIDVIHKKLDNIKCIGFGYHGKNDKMDIEWRYKGFSLLSFEIYYHAMTDSEKDVALTHTLGGIPYNDRVVFHNKGGAIGYLDFPSEDREKFLKKHQPW